MLTPPRGSRNHLSPTMQLSKTLLLGALLLAGCDSKITQSTNTALQAKVNTVTGCFPDHLEKINALLDYAQLWRLNDGSNPADPSGLSWSEQGDGTLDITYTIGAFTITSTITFYSPTGVLQNLAITSTDLSGAVAEAAAQLDATFTTGDSFLVAEWSLSGSGVTGSGAFTGIFSGTSRLHQISTTTATPAGGPPPNADGSITIVDSDTCTLTFNTTGLQTDATTSQDYPIGSVTFTLVGPDATVTATFTMDSTVEATLVVDTVPGVFTINLSTRSVTHSR